VTEDDTTGPKMILKRCRLGKDCYEVFQSLLVVVVERAWMKTILESGNRISCVWEGVGDARMRNGGQIRFTSMCICFLLVFMLFVLSLSCVFASCLYFSFCCFTLILL